MSLGNVSIKKKKKKRSCVFQANLARLTFGFEATAEEKLLTLHVVSGKNYKA